jgi:ferredoxin
MASVANPKLVKELKALGSEDLEACFNCGNCTAVCRLTEGDSVFPRKVIRYAQLGLADRLAESPEPWLCYYCGECTATCPRQAGPGEFMAAARRYAVAQADPTKLSLAMFRYPAVAVGVTLLLAVIFGLFLLTAPAHGGPEHWIFTWIPYETIHNIGLGVGAVLVVLMALGVVNALRRFTASLGGLGALKKIPAAQHAQALKRLAGELVTMRRHGNCEDPGDTATPWYLTPRLVHWTIMWGFFGLLGATTWDFVVGYLMQHPWFLPARVLGTVSGLVMLYGVSISLARRMKNQDPPYQHSVLADWWLLIFLLVLAVTGFWLELAVSFHWQGAVQEIVLLVHTVMALELVLLVTLTKLAHVLYRPLALLIAFEKEAAAARNPS